MDKPQDVGEVCKGCFDYWTSLIPPEEPRKLKALPGKSERHGFVIAVCDYCDGENIFEFGGLDGSGSA
jgi:hypothetical protein